MYLYYEYRSRRVKVEVQVCRAPTTELAFNKTHMKTLEDQPVPLLARPRAADGRDRPR